MTPPLNDPRPLRRAAASDKQEHRTDALFRAVLARLGRS